MHMFSSHSLDLLYVMENPSGFCLTNRTGGGVFTSYELVQIRVVMIIDLIHFL